MTQPYTTIEFSGIDANDPNDGLPGWYRDATDARAGNDTAHPSLAELIRPPRNDGHLPDAVERPIAVRDEERSGDANTHWREDDRHIAIVNPEWEGDTADDAPDSPVWHIPTGSYAIVNPVEAYGPLGAVLRGVSADDDAPDPGHVFGQARLFGQRRDRPGGEVHMDVICDGIRVMDRDAMQQSFALGVQTGYDFFGGRTLYAEIIAYDTRDGTEMRGLTDIKSRRHVGSAGETVAEWWRDVLDKMDTASETLFQVIVDAREYTLDFTDRPFDLAEFYELLGYAPRLAGKAADRRPRSSPLTIDAWHLYKLMAETLTEDFNGKDDGQAARRYISRANEILYTPPKAESRACKAKAKELRGQDTLADDDATAADVLDDHAASAQDAVGQYVSMRDRLQSLLDEAEA